MKKILKILYIILNLLFLSIFVLIIINAFVQNKKILLAVGIITLVAFAFSLIHFVLSKIFKIKLALYAIYLFLSLAGFSVITIALIAKIKILEYVAYAILVPTYPVGIYLEHEDEIKEKTKKKIN